MFRFGFRDKSSDLFDLVRSNRFEGNSGRDQPKEDRNLAGKEPLASASIPSHPIGEAQGINVHSYPLYVNQSP